MFPRGWGGAGEGVARQSVLTFFLKFLVITLINKS